MTRLWWLRTRNRLRRDRRQVLVVAVLGLGSVAMVFLSWWSSPDRAGWPPDLWMNIGADLQTASIVEHARLDPSAVVERIRRGRERVAILETWTGLLEEPYRDRFVDALRTALSNQAVVRILLLDPDSEGAQMLRVRVYDASPSVQMYRCDNKAFIAFFPIDQSTYDAQQIEALMNTPIGDFVQSRFDELWSAPTTADLPAVTALRPRWTRPTSCWRRRFAAW
jgi:hypothetical protein